MDTSLSSDAQLWSLIAGAVSPFVIALIQQPRFSSSVRAILTAALSVAIAFGTTYLTDGVDAGNVVHSALLVFALAITVYHGFGKPTGIAPAIEAHTSPGSAGADRLPPPADG